MSLRRIAWIASLAVYSPLEIESKALFRFFDEVKPAQKITFAVGAFTPPS